MSGGTSDDTLIYSPDEIGGVNWPGDSDGVIGEEQHVSTCSTYHKNIVVTLKKLRNEILTVN